MKLPFTLKKKGKIFFFNLSFKTTILEPQKGMILVFEEKIPQKVVFLVSALIQLLNNRHTDVL